MTMPKPKDIVAYQTIIHSGGNFDYTSNKRDIVFFTRDIPNDLSLVLYLEEPLNLEFMQTSRGYQDPKGEQKYKPLLYTNSPVFLSDLYETNEGKYINGMVFLDYDKSINTFNILHIERDNKNTDKVSQRFLSDIDKYLRKQRYEKDLKEQFDELNDLFDDLTDEQKLELLG